MAKQQPKNILLFPGIKLLITNESESQRLRKLTLMADIDTGPGSDGYGVHPTAAGINALVSLVMGTVTGSMSSTQSNPCCST